MTKSKHLCACSCYCHPRVEPGFLLQGVVASVIPANKITTPGPKLMEMGEVGWAGGKLTRPLFS